MNDYRQLAMSIAAITEEDLILFKVSADEKAHIVGQYNRALVNAQGDGTDVAQIFLKPLIAKYPSWGDAALVFGLCLAREYQFKRAEESLEFAINNILSTEINLQIAQEALRMVREDAKNPIPQQTVSGARQEKGSMVSEMGAVGDRRGMQAPILMRASRNPAKAQMASDKERREIMMRAASSNGELPDDDIMVDIPSTPQDRVKMTVRIIVGVLILAAVICLIYFLLVPAIGKVKKADDTNQRLEYLTQKLGENKDDPEVKAILDDYIKKYDIDLDAKSDETTTEAEASTSEETETTTEATTEATTESSLEPSFATEAEETAETAEGETAETASETVEGEGETEATEAEQA